jgi:hypothetical protein
VKAVNPNCGHPCTLPCHCIASIDMNSIPVPKSIVEEANLGTNGNILATSNLILAKRCTETIQLNRKCGHQERIECSKLRKPLKECKEMSTKLSPLCGHLLPLPCYVSSQLSFHIWSSDIVDTLGSETSISVGMKPLLDLDSYDADLQKSVKSCLGNLQVTLRCGHRREVKCSQMLVVVTEERQIVCDKPVDLKLL